MVVIAQCDNEAFSIDKKRFWRYCLYIGMKKFKIIVGTFLAVVGLLGGLMFASKPVLAACAEDEIEISISLDGKSNCIKKSQSGDLKTNPIYIWLVWILRFLSAGVGIAVVGGIVYGGILYLTARDNSSQTQKAVNVITNSVIGLLLYILMFAFLNYLIPGGIIS